VKEEKGIVDVPPVIIELRGKSAAQLTATSDELGPVSKAGSQALAIAGDIYRRLNWL